MLDDFDGEKSKSVTFNEKIVTIPSSESLLRSSAEQEDGEDWDDETVAKLLIVAPKSPASFIQGRDIHLKEQIQKDRRRDKTHLSFDRSKMNGNSVNGGV